MECDAQNNGWGLRRRVQIAIVTLALVFALAVPAISASGPGGVCPPVGVGFGCTRVAIHFTESLSCYLVGTGPQTWLGTYCFEGGLGIGCGPNVVYH